MRANGVCEMKIFEVVEKDGSSSKVKAEIYRVRGEKLVFFIKGTSVCQYERNSVERIIEEHPVGGTPLISQLSDPSRACSRN